METQQSNPGKPAKRKRQLRYGRIAAVLGVLAFVAVVLYGMSLYNSSLYYLVVEPTQVRVMKGRMLPFGRESYVPLDPKLRKAYRNVPLPSGMKLPKGSTSYGDRSRLDDALYRILKDAAAHTLAQDDERTPELTSAYLKQIDALTGLSEQQRNEAQQLRRDARYVEARGLVANARTLLQEAEEKFRAAAQGDGGGQFSDGRERAAIIRGVLLALGGPRPKAEATETGPAAEAAAESSEAAAFVGPPPPPVGPPLPPPVGPPALEVVGPPATAPVEETPQPAKPEAEDPEEPAASQTDAPTTSQAGPGAPRSAVDAPDTKVEPAAAPDWMRKPSTGILLPEAAPVSPAVDPAGRAPAAATTTTSTS